MSSWAEIQKLAADLQRIQLGDAAKRLSERNCVEVVYKLTELELVDLVYSIDGKEYITRQYLCTQIKNECYGSRGRVCLVDLQQALNVEYQQVEAQVQEIIKTDPSFIISVGQLISREYLENVCCEINSRLQEEGHLTISQITKSYDLPSDLLQKEIYNSLGKTIQGFADKDDRSFLYTRDYVAKQKALLRGALSAVTKITPVSQVLSRLKLHPSVFFQLFDELLTEGAVKGQLTGGRHADRAVFVPHLYTELVRSYAEDFYQNSGFLGLGSLKKLGVTDPSKFLTEFLTEEEVGSVVMLESCALSSQCWCGIVASTEEIMEKRGWIGIIHKSRDTCSQVFGQLFVGQIVSRNLRITRQEWVCCDSEEVFLYVNSLVSESVKLFENKILERAESATSETMKLLKIEKNKENLSSPGEESTKGEDDAAETGESKLEFMNQGELLKFLWKEEKFSDCPEQVLAEIAEKVRPELNQKYRAKLESVYMTSQADVASKMKQSHAEFQEQMKAIYQNISMFDSGADCFEESVAGQLRGYLLRTLCTDASNVALAYVMGITETVTQKISEKAIKELNVTSAGAFKKLYGTLTAKSEFLDDFYAALGIIHKLRDNCSEVSGNVRGRRPRIC